MKVAPPTQAEVEAFLDGDFDNQIERARRAVRHALADAEGVLVECRARGLLLEQSRVEVERLEGYVARMRATIEGIERRARDVARSVDAAPDQRRQLLTCTPLEEWPAEPHAYFLIEDTGDYIKIGFSSSSADMRRATLQTGNPRELVLIAALVGGRAIESRLHKAFREEHYRGEWFRVSERLAAFVLEVRAGHDVDWYLRGAA